MLGDTMYNTYLYIVRMHILCKYFFAWLLLCACVSVSLSPIFPQIQLSFVMFMNSFFACNYLVYCIHYHSITQVAQKLE